MVSFEALLILTLVGFGAGFASGLFGVGGGVITVPGVLFLAGVSFREAVATSLLAMTLTTPLGLWSHHRAGKVRWATGLHLGAAGTLGVFVAQVVDPYLAEAVLLWLFAAVLLYAAQRLAYGTVTLLPLRGWPALSLVGFVGGLVAKLLGIGGGIVMVPSLVFLGHDMHVAVATSLVAVWTNAALSSVGNVLQLAGGNWILWAGPVAAGSLAGVFAGSRTGLRTGSEPLRRAFSVLLAVIALLLVHRSLR